MINSILYDNGVIEHLFCNELACVPVNLKKISGAKVVWVNQYALNEDPRYISKRHEYSSPEAYILEHCAYSAVENDITDHSVPWHLGYADRYGGNGISTNGGSGRAAIVNGYYVKGTGRTDLLGKNTDITHISGKACLDECIREAIFSEIVRRKFPHSGVPTLAIIDIHDTDISGSPPYPRFKHRALLVRPVFIRPAHFQRAVTFTGVDARGGYQDSLRVNEMFSRASEIYGKSLLQKTMLDLPRRWIDQSTYGYVNRIRPGAYSTSNIGIDGKLVDFGAMTSVPCWSNHIYMINEQPFRQNTDQIFRLTVDLYFYCAKYLGDNLFSDWENQLNLKESLVQFQRRATSTFILDFFGVDRPIIAHILSDETLLNEIFLASNDLFEYYQNNDYDMFDLDCDVRGNWDLTRLTTNDVKKHHIWMKSIIDALTNNMNIVCANLALHAGSLKCIERNKMNQLISTHLGKNQDEDFSIGRYIENSIQESCAVLC
jgi:hypothetical protein